MIKQVFLLFKKPEMSSEEFRRYYETRHVPLAQKLVPRFEDYRRNYVIRGAAGQGVLQNTGPPAPDFDAISEIWFRDQGALNKLAEDMRDPAIREAITRDEENLFDGRRTRIFMMDERVTPPSALGSSAGLVDDGSMLKMMVTVRRCAGTSREHLIDNYETRLAPLVAKTMRMIAGYRRNYIMLTETRSDVDEFDVMTEFWFHAQSDFEAMRAALADPKTRQLFADYEANLFDHTSIRMFRVDECVTRGSRKEKN